MNINAGTYIYKQIYGFSLIFRSSFSFGCEGELMGMGCGEILQPILFRAPEYFINLVTINHCIFQLWMSG